MIDALIASSLLILILLTLRFFLKGKISPLLQYSLWGLVGLRLLYWGWLDLIPLSSPLSILNITEKAGQNLQSLSDTELVLQGIKEPTPIDNGVLILENIQTGVMVRGEGISPLAAVDWQLVFMIFWGIGSLLCLGWFLYVNKNFSRKLIANRRFLREIPFRGKEIIKVYETGEIDSPCLMGFWEVPAIYVTPEVAADSVKMNYAITHELCHYRHHDLLWSSWRILLVSLYWFNPLVWAAAYYSRLDSELACDDAVLKNLPKESRLEYGRILLEIMEPAPSRKKYFTLATTMGSFKGMKERIGRIANHRPMRTSTLVLLFLVLALSIGCTFTATSSTPDKPPGSSGPITDEIAKEKLEQFGQEWGNAWSQRNGKVIHSLCLDDEAYGKIGEIAENGEYYIGMSSPWPWDPDHVVEVKDDNTVEISYYYRTSNPSVYVARETLQVVELKGELKVVSDEWVHYDQIRSKAEFEEAYRLGIPDFEPFAEAYQFQRDISSAGEGTGWSDPATAAIQQLNLSEVRVKGRYEDPNINEAWVVFQWPDGEVEVRMKKAETDIWIPVTNN
jgi:beta-lactamase regulating signal transducer with metallopeptidase domain